MVPFVTGREHLPAHDVLRLVEVRERGGEEIRAAFGLRRARALAPLAAAARGRRQRERDEEGRRPGPAHRGEATTGGCDCALFTACSCFGRGPGGTFAPGGRKPPPMLTSTPPSPWAPRASTRPCSPPRG